MTQATKGWDFVGQTGETDEMKFQRGFFFLLFKLIDRNGGILECRFNGLVKFLGYQRQVCTASIDVLE